jgi:hypothetical protein
MERAKPLDTELGRTVIDPPAMQILVQVVKGKILVSTLERCTL